MLLTLCNYRKRELLRFTKLFQRGESISLKQKWLPVQPLPGVNIFCLIVFSYFISKPLMPTLATWNGKSRICSLYACFSLLNFLNNTKRMMTVCYVWKITENRSELWQNKTEHGKWLCQMPGRFKICLK